MTRDLTLSQLTTELTDFLGLPDTLDLPPVYKVHAERCAHDPQWTVRALITGVDDGARYEAIGAWAAFAGRQVELSEPYPGSAQPSGMQRTLSLRVVVAEVPIRLIACVDGLFTVPRQESAVAL